MDDLTSALIKYFAGKKPPEEELRGAGMQMLGTGAAKQAGKQMDIRRQLEQAMLAGNWEEAERLRQMINMGQTMPDMFPSFVRAGQ